MSRYRFIVSERATFAVRLLCRVLDVSPSGFYEWCSRSPSDRELSDAALLERIRKIHEDNKGRYGAPRIHAELRAEHGVRVSRKRVERLMRLAGLAGRHQRRRRSLTRQDKAATAAPDLLGRDFAAAPDLPATGDDAERPGTSAPGARMVGDITYLATGEGWLYLADVLDLSSRAVLGYAMADHMRAELVCDALQMAAGRIQLPQRAIFHSDRGSVLKQHGDRVRLSHLNTGAVRHVDHLRGSDTFQPIERFVHERADWLAEIAVKDRVEITPGLVSNVEVWHPDGRREPIAAA